MDDKHNLPKRVSLPGHAFSSCVVYSWMRKNQCLYIGMSTKGLGRLGSHHIIGVREGVQSDDALDIWLCSSLTEALDLEFDLIKTLHPVYNYNSRKKKESAKDKELVEKGSELDQLRNKYPQFDVESFAKKYYPTS